MEFRFLRLANYGEHAAVDPQSVTTNVCVRMSVWFVFLYSCLLKGEFQMLFLLSNSYHGRVLLKFAFLGCY